MILTLIILFTAEYFLVKKAIPVVPAPAISDETRLRAESGMKRFTDYQEILSFMEDNRDSSGENYDKAVSLDTSAGWTALPETANSSSQGWGLADAPSGAPSDASANYSTTNIQVAGVDEGDIIKTDGNYIYSTSGQQVLIIKAVPGDEAETISTIDLDYTPAGLYLSGERLIVFGSGYDVRALQDYGLLKGGRNGGYADLRIYDISDRKNPKQEKQYDFEGSYANSRLIGDYLYLVTATYPEWIYYDDTRPIPYMLEDGIIDPLKAKPDVYYFDFPYSSQNFTSISAINIKDPGQDIASETYVLDGNQNTMYVSADNLYITFSKRVSEEELALAVFNEQLLPRLSAKEQEQIREIENTKSYILDSEEKTEKVFAIYKKYASGLSDEDQQKLSEEMQGKLKERYASLAGEMQKTVIHKIAIKEGSLNYKSQGEVPGRVLNQYAMDESAEGLFRIATTVDANWSGISGETTKSYNNLYVLDQEMKRLGMLEHIAEGESIYSVRFMGERAYMVTFKRTDPLFVIGLRYPDKPVILGELKVPGYSTYLHPYGDDMLIGLGKNADDDGRDTGGIKLSLFDATDVAAPKEIDNYVFGGYGSNSSALNDPKGFLFSAEKNLLVIPALVRKTDTKSYYGTLEACGSAVFKVDENGFTFRSYIDHRTDEEKLSNYYYGNDARRSLYIGDSLYTVSDNFLKVNELDDLEEMKSIKLTSSRTNGTDEPQYATE